MLEWAMLVKEEQAMGNVNREDIKQSVEGSGLICDCGAKVYEVGKGAIERQPNYNKYFDYLECPQCRKVFYL